MSKEFGDFQTSLPFAENVCRLLKSMGLNPEIVIEPTCGEGNFILAALKTFTGIKELSAIDIQKHYVEASQEKIKNLYGMSDNDTPHISIVQDDIFIHKFDSKIFDKDKEILLVGNPPWVTNSDLGGKNLPKKSNFKKNNGLAAITGKANFDISEYILLHLLKTFKGLNGHLAFLCKTQVARNIVQFLPATILTASEVKMYLFNSKKEFNVNVDACLFVCKLNHGLQDSQCKVYDIDNPEIELYTFGWIEDKFVSNIAKYEKTQEIDGISPFVWRSGIKHDCSKVMELEGCSNGCFKNKLGETFELEKDIVYPFLKSSNLRKLIVFDAPKNLIVTQKKPGEDTTYIANKYPKIWSYLKSHKTYFDKRKSIIYRNNPDFSIFGIGDYSFKPYKIAISGLYKEPIFSLLVPNNNKVLMVDDSCYFIGFDNIKYALITLATLNSEVVREFLGSIAFIDAKRPYTKDILMKIDILKAVKKVGYLEIINYLNKNNLMLEEISQDDFSNYGIYVSKITV
ncbi:hypothetical protein [Methanococcoides sp. FTZ1]|uniref:hypothetical protein n=1 Tax=Methanococcoides sp. FTZ1 TaxID=3439061 RepID=UPI003F87AA1E